MNAKKTIIIEPPCFYCKWLIRYPYCVAFPEGIPEEIRTGGNQHTEPMKGDAGFRFEPYKRKEADVDTISNIVKKTLERHIAKKGGEGSGHYGHAGRPGKRGGSLPGKGGSGGLSDFAEIENIGKRKDAFNALSNNERDAIARADESIMAYQRELLGDTERPYTDSLKDDLKARVGQYEDLLTGVSKGMISDTVEELRLSLEGLGVNESNQRALCMEAVDALIAQEHESMRRQLGDHGIHHIRGNIETAINILQVVPGNNDTLQDVAMVYMVNIFHDTGYLTEPSRIFLDTDHPRWSRQHYDENIRPLVAKAFGKNVAGNIATMIEEHASTDIDWENDPVKSAIRTSDNLSLFQKEKLPSLFRYVPANISVLSELAAGQIPLNEARSLMLANISKAKGLSPKVIAALKDAVREVSAFTPKMTLGMLGGDIKKFGWSSNKGLVVKLKKNDRKTALQKIMDLGQAQFAKLAKTYGIDPERFLKTLSFTLHSRKTGAPVLTSEIIA